MYEHLCGQKLIISWKCYAWPFGTCWWIIIKYSENVTFHCKEIGLFLVSGGIWSLLNSGHPFLVRCHVICFGGPRGVWWTRTRHRNVLLRIPQVRTKYCDVAFGRHPLRYLALCINWDDGAQKNVAEVTNNFWAVRCFPMTKEVHVTILGTPSSRPVSVPRCFWWSKCEHMVLYSVLAWPLFSIRSKKLITVTCLSD